MEPSKEWKETVAPDEEDRLPQLAEKLSAAQRARDGSPRALHAKQHAGLRATFTVLPNLPAPARQGLFAKPAEYRAYVRLSNGAGIVQPDRTPDLRGLAVKVLGVDGPKVLGDARTQDLLFIDSPTVPFRTPDEFVTFVTAVSPPGGGFGRVLREVGLFRSVGLLASLARTAKGRPRSLADRVYYTAAAISFGPYAARLALFPLTEVPAEPGASSAPDYLRDRIAATVAKLPLEYELRAQFFTGPETPIEDSNVPWPSPFVPVARLRIEKQDPSSDAGRRLDAFVESLSFNPWHALVEHRPLGIVMRARKHAYYASIQARKAAGEPDGTEWDGFA